MTAAGPDEEAVALVLQERARHLARPLDDEAPSGRRELLVASVGATRVAFDTARVGEVLPPGPLTRIPGHGHFVAGLRNVRGELLAVADLASLLDLCHDVAIEQRWVVVVEGSRGPLGVLVDKADDLVALLGRDVSCSPAGTRSAAAELVRDVTADGVFVIEPDALLAHSALSIRSSGPGTPTDEERVT